MAQVEGDSALKSDFQTQQPHRADLHEKTGDQEDTFDENKESPPIIHHADDGPTHLGSRLGRNDRNASRIATNRYFKPFVALAGVISIIAMAIGWLDCHETPITVPPKPTVSSAPIPSPILPNVACIEEAYAAGDFDFAQINALWAISNGHTDVWPYALPLALPTRDRSMQRYLGLAGSVAAVAAEYPGSLIAAATTDGHIAVWKTAEAWGSIRQSPLDEWPLQSGRILDMAFVADRNALAAIILGPNEVRHVATYNIRGESDVASDALKIPSSDIPIAGRYPTLSADGQHVAYLDPDWAIHIIGTQNGRKEVNGWRPAELEEPIALALSFDGRYLLAGDRKMSPNPHFSLHLFEVATRKRISTQTWTEDDGPMLAVSRDGTRAIHVGKIVRGYDLTRRPSKKANADEVAFLVDEKLPLGTAINMTADSEAAHFWVGTKEKHIFEYELSSDALSFRKREPFRLSSEPRAVGYHRGPPDALLVGGEDGVVRRYAIASELRSEKLFELPNADVPVARADGRSIYYCKTGNDGTLSVHVFTFEDKTPRQIPGFQTAGKCLSLSVSPSGRKLAIEYSKDTTAQKKSAIAIVSLDGPAETPMDWPIPEESSFGGHFLAFSSDEHFLAFSESNGRLSRLGLDGKEPHPIRSGTAPVSDTSGNAVENVGLTVQSAGHLYQLNEAGALQKWLWNGNAWDMQPQTLRPAVPEARDAMLQCCNIAAARDADAVAAVLRTTSRVWIQQGNTNSEISLSGSGANTVYGIALSDDGTLAAIAVNDWIGIWDVKRRLEVARLEGADTEKKLLAFVDDNRAVVAMGAEDIVIRWNIASLLEQRKALLSNPKSFWDRLGLPNWNNEPVNRCIAGNRPNAPKVTDGGEQ